MSFLRWGLQSWMQDSRWGLTRAEQRVRITSTDLLATLLLMQPRIQMAFWAASAHCWTKSSSSPATSCPSPQGCSPAILYPACIRAWDWRTLCLSWLNFPRFTQAHLSSLSRSLRTASLPSSTLIAPHCLVSLANLLRVCWIPLLMSPTKMLNNAGPKSDPLEMPLVNVLHLDIEPLTATLRVWPSSQFLIHWVVHPWNPCPSYCLFLIVLVVKQGTDWAALFSSSVSPDMGPSPPGCTAVKPFGMGISGFRRSLFLQLVLALASFHSPPLLCPPNSVCAGGGVFGCLAKGLLQSATGTGYPSPSQPPWCYAAFSPSPAAQPPARGGPPPGHTFCRQVCCLSLPQKKGLGTSCSLRSPSETESRTL